ncbi:hypothetical protein [Flectobacillus roseus]|uniref:hypothetical protein n=1 Tax=Flectobacillus roseus TaxID=502259 RepID=UPI0024B774E5|nr:hypothetical protein [Flectobacillus roseus]MDI9872210.1 hypothetical protein [Flectobacillus roseus]
MNWKDELPHLYQNIKPNGGKLKHSIDNSYKSEHLIQHLIIEFNEMDFDYFDPLYEQINAKSNFQMYFVFSSDESKIDIRTIYDLENKEILLDETTSQGAFSNGLILTVPCCKFGEIKNGEISLEMSYFLTDSYVFKSGFIQEHSKIRGTIKTNLTISDLIISVHKEFEDVRDFIKHLPSNFYEIENIRPATDANVIPRDYDLYQIPIRK